MKRFSVFIFIFYLTGNLNAQLKVKGRIVDTTGTPVEAAGISISIEGKESALFFTNTNAKGNYSFFLEDSFKTKPLLIRVNAFGFFTASAPVKTTTDSVNFVLKINPVELPPVEVKDREIKIRKIGDTLNYPVKAFSNASDKVIGDVIKKLPGIEIDINGTIFYNGRPINNFYIDGDNLLDDRYNIASRSLPVDLVDKVQVIENNQHIKALAGIVQTDKAAINIRLKDKAKLNWTNDVTIGAGIENLYSGELITLAFKNKLKAINVLKANNTGNDIVEEVSPNASLSVAGLNESDQRVDLLTIDNIDNIGFGKQRFLFNDAKMLSINTMFKSSGNASARINGYLLADDQHQTSAHSSMIFIPGNTIQYSVSNKLEDRLVKGRVGLTVNANAKKLYFNNTLSYENDDAVTDAVTLLDSLSTKQHLGSGNLILRNTANGVFVIKKKQVVEFASEVSFSKKPENLIISPGLFAESVNKGQPYKQFDQQVNTPFFAATNSFTYRRTFGNFLHTSALGFSYVKQKLNSSLQLEQLNGQTSNAPDSFYNSFELSRWKLFLENEIRWQKNNTLFRFGLPIQKLFLSSYEPVFLPKSESNDFLLFQPTIQYRQQLGKESDLIVKYYFSRNFGNITDIYRGKILQNYREITSNDITYPESAKNQHSATISYSYRNSIKILFFNLSATYLHGNSNYLLSSVVSANSSKTIAVPIENASSIWSVNTNASKYIFALKTTLNVKYSFRLRVYPVFQNGSLFNNTGTSGIYFLSVNTKLAGWLFSKYESSYSLFNTKNASSDTKNNVTQFRQTVTADIMAGNSFSFRFGAEQYLMRLNDNTRHSFYFLDASVKYKFSKPRMDCELFCLNLTNLNQYVINQVYSNSISTSSVMLRPRSILFKCSFSL